MTTVELVQEIGKVFSLRIKQGLHANVEVVDAKVCYGDIRYLITPVSGDGQAWVCQDSLSPVSQSH